MRSVLRPALIAAVGMLVAGCGGAAPATPPPATAPATGGGHGLVFVVTVRLHGAETVSTTLRDTTVTAVSACDRWAQSGEAGLMSIPGAGPARAGSSFSYGALVGGYHGPGVYTALTDLLALNAGGESFDTVQGSSAVEIRINGDGSGSMALSGLQDVADSSRIEAGSVSWTCAPAP